MSLKKIFQTLAEYFKREKTDFAVIGAFALYTYGYIRATYDVDFITRSEFRENVIKYLEALGFETTFSSDAFSNHLHSVGDLRVDIMYVDGKTADSIFSSSEEKLIFDEIKVPVVSAEHLIAMKLFAIKNNPDRKYKDLGDIKEVMIRTKYNQEEVKNSFIKNGLELYYTEILKEIEKNGWTWS